MLVQECNALLRMVHDTSVLNSSLDNVLRNHCDRNSDDKCSKKDEEKISKNDFIALALQCQLLFEPMNYMQKLFQKKFFGIVYWRNASKHRQQNSILLSDWKEKLQVERKIESQQSDPATIKVDRDTSNKDADLTIGCNQRKGNNVLIMASEEQDEKILREKLHQLELQIKQDCATEELDDKRQKENIFWQTFHQTKEASYETLSAIMRKETNELLDSNNEKGSALIKKKIHDFLETKDGQSQIAQQRSKLRVELLHNKWSSSKVPTNRISLALLMSKNQDGDLSLRLKPLICKINPKTATLADESALELLKQSFIQEEKTLIQIKVC